MVLTLPSSQLSSIISAEDLGKKTTKTLTNKPKARDKLREGDFCRHGCNVELQLFPDLDHPHSGMRCCWRWFTLLSCSSSSSVILPAWWLAAKSCCLCLQVWHGAGLRGQTELIAAVGSAKQGAVKGWTEKVWVILFRIQTV